MFFYIKYALLLYISISLYGYEHHVKNRTPYCERIIVEYHRVVMIPLEGAHVPIIE